MSSTSFTFECLIDHLGNPGRFQTAMLLVLYTLEIPVVWATLMMSFAGKVPDWWCQDDVINKTTTCSDHIDNTYYRQCPSRQVSCSDVCFDSQMRTVVSEWNLVCDKSAITATMTSIQMAGNLIGAITSGQIADVYGRKTALYLDVLVLVVSCTIAAFATSWQMYSVCTFFIGIACGGYLVTNFPLAMEFVRAKWRTLLGCFPFWSLGFAAFGLLAWPIHDYQHLCLLVAATAAPFLFTYRYFPESIRWQLSHGKLDDASVTIHRIVKMNKLKMPDVTHLDALAEQEVTRRKLNKSYTFYHLYNTKEKVKKALILQSMWCISSIVYYGLSFGARNLAGDVYLNIALSGLAELPRIPVIIYLNDKIGRRWTCFCFYLLCSLCCFIVSACAVTGSSEIGKIHFAMSVAAKMGITAGWGAMKVFSAEHYPTVVRSLGISVCNIAAGVGSIIAPYTVLMAEHDLVIINAVIGVLVLANAGLPFLLKETVNKPLMDIFKDRNISNEGEAV